MANNFIQINFEILFCKKCPQVSVFRLIKKGKQSGRSGSNNSNNNEDCVITNRHRHGGQINRSTGPRPLQINDFIQSNSLQIQLIFEWIKTSPFVGLMRQWCRSRVKIPKFKFPFHFGRQVMRSTSRWLNKSIDFCLFESSRRSEFQISWKTLGFFLLSIHHRWSRCDWDTFSQLRVNPFHKFEFKKKKQNLHQILGITRNPAAP